MRRRTFIAAGAGLATMGVLAWRYWPEDGFYNECRPEAMPEGLLRHALVMEAIDGLDFSQVWDCHVHLIGTGDSSQGLWVNPEMMSWMHPVKHVQFRFYLDGSCTGKEAVDKKFVERVRYQMAELPRGMKVMLLAFDYYHDKQGRADPARSFFYTPNEYAARIARHSPEQFEWIASVHPYRPDSIALLEQAASMGARAVKWLPEAMGIDPAAKQCIPFYQAMQRLNLPLLSHAGHETAVDTKGAVESSNPLLLRAALDQGVKVIVAHCASLGKNTDLDAGPKGTPRSSFELFTRMMNQKQYEGLLFGDISALLQLNRLDQAIKHLLLTDQWHTRLINGSDYPLPGILPVIPMKQIVRLGLVNAEQATLLREIRRYNPIWFDFVLKRMLRWQGKRFANSVFETRPFFL